MIGFAFPPAVPARVLGHALALAGYADVHSTADAREAIPQAAPLRDVGKVGFPDHIPFEPGPLTADEVAVMNGHTPMGRGFRPGGCSRSCGRPRWWS